MRLAIAPPPEPRSIDPGAYVSVYDRITHELMKANRCPFTSHRGCNLLTSRNFTPIVMRPGWQTSAFSPCPIGLLISVCCPSAIYLFCKRQVSSFSGADLIALSEHSGLGDNDE